jgi:hypothetical protein
MFNIAARLNIADLALRNVAFADLYFGSAYALGGTRSSIIDRLFSAISISAGLRTRPEYEIMPGSLLHAESILSAT